LQLQYAIQTSSNTPGLYLTYTDVLLLLGQTTVAIDVLQKAVGSVSPKSSLLYGRIGELIYADGDKDTGIEYLTEAVDIDPRNRRALEMLKHALGKRAESQAEAYETEELREMTVTESERGDVPKVEQRSPPSPTNSLPPSASESSTVTDSSITRRPFRKRRSFFS
jgi:tetratricopeptide (TPR) repeat protein